MEFQIRSKLVLVMTALVLITSARKGFAQLGDGGQDSKKMDVSISEGTDDSLKDGTIAGVAVAAGYGIYQGGKWLVNKFKSKGPASPPPIRAIQDAARKTAPISPPAKPKFALKFAKSKWFPNLVLWGEPQPMGFDDNEIKAETLRHLSKLIEEQLRKPDAAPRNIPTEFTVKPDFTLPTNQAVFHWIYSPLAGRYLRANMAEKTIELSRTPGYFWIEPAVWQESIESFFTDKKGRSILGDVKPNTRTYTQKPEGFYFLRVLKNDQLGQEDSGYSQYEGTDPPGYVKANSSLQCVSNLPWVTRKKERSFPVSFNNEYGQTIIDTGYETAQLLEVDRKMISQFLFEFCPLPNGTGLYRHGLPLPLHKEGERNAGNDTLRRASKGTFAEPDSSSSVVPLPLWFLKVSPLLPPTGSDATPASDQKSKDTEQRGVLLESTRNQLCRVVASHQKTARQLPPHGYVGSLKIRLRKLPVPQHGIQYYCWLTDEQTGLSIGHDGEETRLVWVQASGEARGYYRRPRSDDLRAEPLSKINGRDKKCLTTKLIDVDFDPDSVSIENARKIMQTIFEPVWGSDGTIAFRHVLTRRYLNNRPVDARRPTWIREFVLGEQPSPQKSLEAKADERTSIPRYRFATPLHLPALGDEPVPEPAPIIRNRNLEEEKYWRYYNNELSKSGGAIRPSRP